ncbi:MAG: guanylate kinase [Candidatus Omnitrophota bacterium]|nr:guanylate kinase [Candidatus Omnitrophota bacterium]
MPVRAGNKGKIFVVSGPSGSGKTTLIKQVLKDRRIRSRFVRSVSYTTRAKRSGERHGRDYFFITRKEFLRQLKAKKFLEWTKYLGYYYGTSREFVEEQIFRGKSIFFCIDIKGKNSIKNIFPLNAVSIFVMPGSLKELPLRIRGRCSRIETGEIRQRVQLAKKEILSAPGYDYTLINQELMHARNRLKEIICKELIN